MKRAKILITIFALFCITAFAINTLQNTTEVIKKVTAALQTGNSSELSKYFTKTVELEILGEENFYSISQAELLLKNFFEKNTPTKFVIGVSNYHHTYPPASYLLLFRMRLCMHANAHQCHNA